MAVTSSVSPLVGVDNCTLTVGVGVGSHRISVGCIAVGRVVVAAVGHGVAGGAIGTALTYSTYSNVPSTTVISATHGTSITMVTLVYT